jgi:hypothetical protein
MKQAGERLSLIGAWGLLLLSVVLFFLVLDEMGPFGRNDSALAGHLAVGCCLSFSLSLLIVIALLVASMRKRRVERWAFLRKSSPVPVLT